MELAKPSVRMEGRKIIAEFDPPAEFSEVRRLIHNAAMVQLSYELRKHQAKIWPE